MSVCCSFCCFFFFNDTATTEIYTLSLHDALPILPPRRASSRVNVAYFAGDFTLPGSVRACHWATLATGERITPEQRRIRTLSRGTRQLLGLRTVLSRAHQALIVLDEPWEGLDVDGCRW